MNHTRKDQPANPTINPKRAWALLHRPFISLGILAGVAVGIVLLANAQQPVLKISNLSNNQFLIEVTNAISTTNYTIYWTPALDDPDYPWVALTNNNVGESNFLVNATGWDVGFFKVLIGTDFDGDGWPEWLDAQPQNPAVGILRVTIDSPTNTFNFN